MRSTTLSLLTVFTTVVAAWLCIIANWLQASLAVALMFTVAMAHGAFLSWDHSRHIRRTREALDELRRSGSVQVLSEEEFYLRFAASVEGARHSADICYLDSRPPDPPRGSAKARYYSRLPALIRSHSQVTFRRITLLTRHTATWIIDLSNQLEGVANFSLKLLQEERPRVGDPISVQCIDDSEAYLVAPAEQRPVGPYRDIRVQSQDAASLLKRYYERLWGRARSLVERGELDQSYLEEIRSGFLNDAGPCGRQTQDPSARD